MADKFHRLSEGGYTGAEQQATLHQPALSAVVSTMDEAVRLAQRVSGMVERLCGAIPTPASNLGKDTDYASIFDGLRGQADNANRQIQNAMDALNRLDRELP